MARVLPYDQYGTYGQVLLIGSFTIALFSIGLGQILYVYLNKVGKEIKVFSSNLMAAVCLGTVGLLCLFFLSDFFGQWLGNPGLSIGIKYYSISILFIIPYISANGYLIFEGKVKASVGISIIVNLFKVVLVVYFIQVYSSVSLALGAISLSYFVQILIGIFLVRKKISFVINKDLFFEQVKKGLPLGLTGILGAGILYIDGLMVSKFEGVEQFAIYRNGAIEVPYLATIYSSVAAIVLPEVAKLFSKKKFSEILDLKRSVIINTMALTYPILVFLLFNSKSLIGIYLGDKYYESALIFAVFNLTLLIRVNDYQDILIAANKGKSLLYYHIFAFVLNIVLNLVFISVFGILGAAIATVLTLFIFGFLLLNHSLSLIERRVIELFHLKKMSIIIGVSVTIASVAYASTAMFSNALIRLVLFSVIYFPCTYFCIIKSKVFGEQLIVKILPKKIYNYFY